MFLALLSNLIFIVWLLLIIYFIMSWFPLNPSGIPAQIKGALHQLFDPILSFIRRFVPPIGMFDTAGIVLAMTLWFLLQITAALR